MKLTVKEAKLTGLLLGTVLIFNRFLLKNYPSAPKSF